MNDEPSGRTCAVDAIYEVLLRVSVKEDGWPPRLTITHPRTIAAIVADGLAEKGIALIEADLVNALARIAEVSS